MNLLSRRIKESTQGNMDNTLKVTPNLALGFGTSPHLFWLGPLMHAWLALSHEALSTNAFLRPSIGYDNTLKDDYCNVRLNSRVDLTENLDRVGVYDIYNIMHNRICTRCRLYTIIPL